MDIHLVAYHLDSNNRRVACNGPELRFISKFLDSFINLTNKDKRIEIRQLFYLLKRHKHEFIATAPFWASSKNAVLFWIKTEYIPPRYYI